MPSRPFFVQPNGECVPLEGEWRVARLAGEWYVLGHHSVVPCGSGRAAQAMLLELQARSDADLLAEEAIDGVDPILDGLGLDRDAIGETEPRP